MVLQHHGLDPKRRDLMTIGGGGDFHASPCATASSTPARSIPIAA
jgi:hypothetical protein